MLHAKLGQDPLKNVARDKKKQRWTDLALHITKIINFRHLLQFMESSLSPAKSSFQLH